MKKWLGRTAQFALLLVMAFCVMELYSYFQKRQDADKKMDTVKSQLSDFQTTSQESEPAEEDEPLVDYTALMQKLRDMNGDSVAYIAIKGSEENQYPVMQTDDNDYYLRRGADKEYSVYGMPFMDYANDPALDDQNTVIYAHLMEYGDVMFGIFRNYLKQSFVDKQPCTFTLTNDQGVYTYKIFTVYHVDEDAPYRYPNRDKSVFLADMEEANAASEVKLKDSFTFTDADRIATLSTCTPDHNSTQRIAVVGVLDKVQRKDGVYRRKDLASAGSWNQLLSEPVKDKVIE